MQDMELVKFISGLGVSGVLVVLVYGLLKGWFVTGREHATLAGLYASMQVQYSAIQVQMTALQTDLQRLRDRDELQQIEINTLRQAVVEEADVDQTLATNINSVLSNTTVNTVRLTWTRENVTLRARVTELERTVGVVAGPRT